MFVKMCTSCTNKDIYIYNLYVIELYNYLIQLINVIHYACCCLPTPMTLASGGSPMFPLVVHQPAYLASSAVTPAGSVHKSRGDNVVRMWVQLKR